MISDVQKVNCPAGAREAALGRAAGDHDFDHFVACGRRTLRGFLKTKLPPLGELSPKAAERVCCYRAFQTASDFFRNQTRSTAHSAAVTAANSARYPAPPSGPLSRK